MTEESRILRRKLTVDVCDTKFTLPISNEVVPLVSALPSTAQSVFENRVEPFRLINVTLDPVWDLLRSVAEEVVGLFG
jgi:hypothetical protein